MSLSQLVAVERARRNFNPLNCQVLSPLNSLVLDMVPLKKPKVTVKDIPLIKLRQLHVLS